ncbi:MAG: hypothetical protein BAJALOKI2v1_110057 [Promethearchaeota archaeon]|nr:MAG: hypothetical protein BAJALOKI2v1_110057 [Candidatus Lokiarchaeota archaeon]
MKHINVLYTWQSSDGTKYYVNLFVKWDKWSEEAEFIVDLTQDEYLRLMENLKKTFKVEKEKEGVISKKDQALYVDFID